MIWYIYVNFHYTETPYNKFNAGGVFIVYIDRIRSKQCPIYMVQTTTELYNVSTNMFRASREYDIP